MLLDIRVYSVLKALLDSLLFFIFTGNENDTELQTPCLYHFAKHSLFISFLFSLLLLFPLLFLCRFPRNFPTSSPRDSQKLILSERAGNLSASSTFSVHRPRIKTVRNGAKSMSSAKRGVITRARARDAFYLPAFPHSKKRKRREIR